MSNSIRDALTRDDAISDIILSISGDIKNKKLHIILEGDADKKLFSKFFNNNVMMHESYSGKNGVIEIINHKLFINNPLIIGIIDRDYDKYIDDSRVFYYDYCCMEMMLLSNREVYYSIYCEYYRGELSKDDLYKMIFYYLKYLSIIRKISSESQWGLKLDCISLSKIYNTSHNAIDQFNRKLIESINKINNNYINEQRLKSLDKAYEKIWNEETLLNNTNGHDYFKLFAAICNCHKKKHINYEEIQSAARCAFNIGHLKNSDLYSDIYGYIIKFNINILEG